MPPVLPTEFPVIQKISLVTGGFDRLNHRALQLTENLFLNKKNPSVTAPASYQWNSLYNKKSISYQKEIQLTNIARELPPEFSVNKKSTS